MLPLWLRQWLMSVVLGPPNTNGCRRGPADLDIYARKPPPNARIDLSERRNPLTRPPSSRLEAGIETSSSRPCILLDVLPLETRQQIWAEVLGGHRFHLEIRAAVLTGLLCVSPDPDNCYRGRADCRARLSGTKKLLEKNLLLSSLLSCRQIYSEAIHYLYSANTFVTSDTGVMEYLPILLLPQRIDAIRSLGLYWNLSLNPLQVLRQDSQEERGQQNSNRPDTWSAIWHNISTMKGLRTLNVKLQVSALYWGNINKDTARQLLQPIRELVIPGDFILSLPFPAMDGSAPQINFPWAAVDGWKGSDPWDDLPCTIRRVSRTRDL